MTTYRRLTSNQLINMAYYCGGEKTLSPPRRESLPDSIVACLYSTHGQPT